MKTKVYVCPTPCPDTEDGSCAARCHESHLINPNDRAHKVSECILKQKNS